MNVRCVTHKSEVVAEWEIIQTGGKFNIMIEVEKCRMVSCLEKDHHPSLVHVKARITAVSAEKMIPQANTKVALLRLLLFWFS